MDALILAGGRSTRMGGTHKGSLIYHEASFTQTLIREFEKEAKTIWLSYGSVLHETYENCKIVTDIYPDCGPIGGIHAGLMACESDALMVTACDMPLIKIEFFRHLAEELEKEERGIILPETYGGVVPVMAGRIHPLAAIYRKSGITVLENQIKAGNYRLRDALKGLKILYVDLTGSAEYAEMLRNINTIEEYEELDKRG